MISFGKKREFIFAREDERTDLDIVNDFIQLLKREVAASGHSNLRDRTSSLQCVLNDAYELRQIIKERG